MTAGRDGGLQSLELHGIAKLKINDEKMARAILNVVNNDKKGIQMQVRTEPYIVNLPLDKVVDKEIFIPRLKDK